jgi:hypothetical protein
MEVTLIAGTKLRFLHSAPAKGEEDRKRVVPLRGRRILSG